MQIKTFYNYSRDAYIQNGVILENESILESVQEIIFVNNACRYSQAMIPPMNIRPLYALENDLLATICRCDCSCNVKPNTCMQSFFVFSRTLYCVIVMF